MVDSVYYVIPVICSWPTFCSLLIKLVNAFFGFLAVCHKWVIFVVSNLIPLLKCKGHLIMVYGFANFTVSQSMIRFLGKIKFFLNYKSHFPPITGWANMEGTSVGKREEACCRLANHEGRQRSGNHKSTTTTATI